MASCSLYQPGLNPLLSKTEMESILLFERVVADWVREVHMFNSKTKKGKNFVIFRNSSNTRLRGVEEFGAYLEANSFDTSFLETAIFKSDKDSSIVCNKVGANVVARKEASKWVEDVKNNKVEKLVPAVTRNGLPDLQLRNTSQFCKLSVEQSKVEVALQHGIISTTSSNIEDIAHSNFSNIEKNQHNQNKVQNKPSSKPIQMANAEDKVNTSTFWVGVDSNKDEDESQYQAIQDGKETIAEKKLDKNPKLYLGNIDDSWMESLDEHMDSNVDASKTIINWMESMGCPENERAIQIMVGGNRKEQENVNFGPMDDSWMEALGCMSDTEEEENSAIEKNIAGIDKALVTPLALGTIDNTWMESMGDIIDSDEKEKEEPNVKNADSYQRYLEDFDYKSIENGDTSLAHLNENYILSISNTCQNSVYNPSEINDLSPTNTFLKINGVEKNTNIDETQAKNKTKLISEVLCEKQKEKETKDIFAGDFCAAWLDCFESISELDHNLSEKQNNQSLLEQTVDNRFLDDFKEEKQDKTYSPPVSVSLDKKTKDDMNHKIFSDSLRNTTEGKEIEMLILLENGVLQSETTEQIDPKHLVKQEIQLQKEDNICSTSTEKNLVGKEGNKGSRNVFKFGDAETFRWDLRENSEYITKQKGRCNNSNYILNNQFEGGKEINKNQEQTKPAKKSTSPLKFENVDNEAGSLFLPSFLKLSEDNEPKEIPNQIKDSKSNPENVCPFSYNLGFYSSTPRLVIKNSGTSSSDDEEQGSVARNMKKKQKRRKLMKGKQGEEEIMVKASLNDNAKVKIAGELDDEAKTPKYKWEDTNVEEKDKSGEYSSNWETDEEEDCPQSSDTENIE